MIQNNNSVPSAETKDDSSNVADVTTSSPNNAKPLLADALVNHNELMLPINFKALAAEHGVRKGTIFYSDTWKSWVIQGHPEIDLICIDAPIVKGQTVEGLKGKASRFNGKQIQNVIIRSNMWCAVF
jgi:hypothetical protein